MNCPFKEATLRYLFMTGDSRPCPITLLCSYWFPAVNNTHPCQQTTHALKINPRHAARMLSGQLQPNSKDQRSNVNVKANVQIRHQAFRRQGLSHHFVCLKLSSTSVCVCVCVCVEVWTLLCTRLIQLHELCLITHNCDGVKKQIKKKKKSTWKAI